MEGKDVAPADLGLHRLEAYEPRPEDRTCQALQRPRRPPVLLDLVVERAEDTGDCELISRAAEGQTFARLYLRDA